MEKMTGLPDIHLRLTSLKTDAQQRYQGSSQMKLATSDKDWIAQRIVDQVGGDAQNTTVVPQTVSGLKEELTLFEQARP